MEGITKMKKCINGYFICLLMAIICFVLVDNMHLRFNRPVINHTDTIIHTDTIRYTDTFKIEKTKPIYIEKIKTDTVYDKKGNEILLNKEYKVYNDSIVTCAGDSLEVTSYISGYEASKDSLKVKLSRREVIKTEYITNYVAKPKAFKDHFKVGFGVGYGYGLKNKEIEPFVGINFSYNF